MPKITALEPQERKGRLNVFVDGRFVIGVGEAVAADLRLIVGREIDRDRLREIVAAEEVNKAYESALRSLESRPRAEGEIRRKLTTAGYDAATVQAVIDKLKRARLLDDSAFASQWVEGRSRPESSRPVGRRRIAQELFQKGVAKETAAEALGSVTEDDEYALALAAARKKIRVVPGDPEAVAAERRKLIPFLQRRGFGWSIVKRVASEVLGGDADDLDEPVDE
jgi:regulatory protein